MTAQDTLGIDQPPEPKRSESRQVFANTVMAWAGTGLNGIVGFFLVPFLLLRLGKAGYGLIALLGSIVALTPLVDLGLRAALCRHLAEHVARRDLKSFNELVSSALLIYLLIGTSCAAACFYFAAPIGNWFHVPVNSLAEGRILIRWYAGAVILVGFVSPVFSGTLIALGRFDVLNAIGLVVALLRAVGLMIALGPFHRGLYGWAGVNFAASLLTLFLMSWIARRLWPTTQIRFRHVRIGPLRSMFSMGGYLFTLQITMVASMQSDPIVISRFLGPAAVALYNPGLSLVSTFRPVILALAEQSAPLATHYHVKGEQARLQDLLVRGTRYTLLMGILASCVLGVFALPIMNVWLRRSLGSDCAIAAKVLLAWALVDLGTYALGTQWAVLQASKNLATATWLAVLLAVLNISASIYLVSSTSLGVVGVVLPTIAQRLITLLVLVPYSAARCGLTTWHYFTSSYVRPIMVGITLAAGAVVLRNSLRPDTLGTVAFSILAVTIAWCGLTWFFAFESHDRMAFRSLVAERIGFRFTGSV